MVKILLINGDSAKLVDKTKFTEEAKLQDYLEKYPTLIPLSEMVERAADLLCIGREVPAGPGWVDLLFIDKDGLLTIVETKLAKNPEARREVIGQIIEYASYASQWTADDVYKVANEYFVKSDLISQDHKDKTLDEIIREMSSDEFSTDDFKTTIGKNLKDGRMRLIIAVDELIEPLRAMVIFLNSYSNFDIFLLQVSSFEESFSQRVLLPSLFGYTHKEAVSPPPKAKINEDIFLARCREGEHEKAIELYLKAKDLKESRKDNGDYMNWGVSGYSYRMPWKGYPNDETIFTAAGDGSLSLWPDVLGRSGEVGQKYSARLRSIPAFSSKVADFRLHKYPNLFTDKMDTTDIDAFISAIRDLGSFLNELSKEST